jgi:hypothetical protein
MPAPSTYEAFYQQYDVAIRAAADSATAAGIAKTAELLPVVMVPLIIAVGILMAMGLYSLQRLYRDGLMVIVLSWLVVGAAYTPMVRDLFIDTIPNEVASSLFGGVNQRLTVVQQFDAADKATGFFASRIIGQASGIISTIKIAPMAWIAYGAAKIFIALMFFVWMIARALTYIGVALGAFLLITLVFESTRGYFMGLVSKIVGLVIWQIAASILLHVMLQGMFQFIRAIIDNSENLGLEQQVDKLIDIAVYFLGCLAMLLALPAIAGGYTASAAQMATFGAGRMAMGAAGSMGGAAHSMKQAATNLRRYGRGRGPRDG